jgi:hypothetical protein
MFWSLHYPRPYRIQMNISAKRKKISILFNQDPLVTPLKQMPTPSIFTIKVTPPLRTSPLTSGGGTDRRSIEHTERESLRWT